MFPLESFIEVSDEEEQEDVQLTTEEKGTPDVVQKPEERSEDNLEEAPTSLISEDEEDKNSRTEGGPNEGTEMGASASPAVNEWEQLGAVSRGGDVLYHKH